MKLLVTGGSAFIGSTLAENLSSSFHVHAPTSSELNLLDYEKVSAYIKKNNFDVIIHSANHLVHPLLKESKSPEIQLINNMKMFFNIALNKKSFGKMIYFGSGAEFGREHWTSKMEETYFGQNFPTDQYGLSKYFMNAHCRLSQNIYNLRLFGMFGEKDDWRFRFIPYLCAKASLKEDLIINQDSIFGFLYIDDLVQIVKKFIETEVAPGDYNVCNDEELKLTEIAKIISNLDEKRQVVVKNKGILTSYSGNNSKLRDTFPDIKFTSVQEGIQRIYKFYKDNPKIIDSTKFLIK
ncbi:NAD(P)-dependent oxidoreductase [bacterium]|jgi:GDP-L-fucose synthase|nr:NAD(P)-dependent oxidoreductase [bacterium]MBT3795261.1 NAD(P)-dependent oxidoreductase [bacterium]MBT4634722.1 NAD(P)-dependent oxidoreductase [bacterium]